MKFNYQFGGQTYDIELHKTEDSYAVKVGEQNYEVDILQIGDGELLLSIDGLHKQVYWAVENKKRWVAIEGKDYLIEKATPGRRSAVGGDGGSLVTAPMPGQVREVLVAEGDKVEQGQKLMLLEAMKMEMRILAPRAGVIASLNAEAGQQVDKDAVLAEVE